MSRFRAYALVVDDDAGIRSQIADRLGARGHRVEQAASGEEALGLLRTEEPDVLILDLHLPGVSGLELLKTMRSEGSEVATLVITAYGDVDTAVEAMKLGALDFIPKPFEAAHLDVLVDKAVTQVGLRQENQLLRAEIRRREPPVIVESPRMREVMRIVDKVAKAPTTVLVLGESGTGKEVIARRLHARSPRRRMPFVAANCAAMPSELVESELFGHEQGAFTGATRTRKGLFEVAHGGTLFLDEVGELPPALQPKLLRVLQDQTFSRVGSTRTTEVDVRVVAASNRDLPEATRTGEFRKDLYYRLNVVSIEVPPLRQRPEDVEPLARHFVAHYSSDTHRRVRELSPEALALLRAYTWPGNVRELQNAVERAVVLAEEQVLSPDDLPSAIRRGEGGGATVPSGDEWVDLGYHGAVKEFKRRLLRAALERHDGVQVAAARALSLHPTYLSRLLKNLGA